MNNARKIILILSIVAPIIGFSQCIEGNCENGVGTFVDGKHISFGSWKIGELNGTAHEITFDDNGNLQGVFSGEMKMEVINGWGTETLYTADGTLLGTYVGNWINNEYNGWGIWIEPNGNIEKGIFKNSVLQK